MPHRPLDATLRPPNEPEALGQVPKWLKHSPNLMAPYNRPQIERTKTVYKYGDVIESKLPTMKHDMASQQDEELHFDSRFESGNLLSSTRLYRADVAKESTYGAARLPIDCPWVVDYEYNLQMHPDLRTSALQRFISLHRLSGLRVAKCALQNHVFQTVNWHLLPFPGNPMRPVFI